ncbi:MAG: hypothetical protein HF976_07380 [ANME-2 cluster archaeon]|nr:hypothetical protein [ANME-2 cluster archaeon]MBC2707117.1 hypothetical protein [ANME-2 cluster archaeon]MBC2747541.1 hypothetical protein [ANME-2 cluster archaeon]
MDPSRRKAIGGLIFALGLIVMLIGAMTELYETKIGVIIMLAVWFIGGTLAALIFGGKEEPPEQSES